MVRCLAPLWGAVVLGELVPGVALVYTRLPLANFLARLRRDAKVSFSHWEKVARAKREPERAKPKERAG
ncbi:MAG: hypothetical protein DMG13_14090 [Acidobacteria bacterium]|nr:MAG: hypothetical protein DMG13_14090 [Acidobacteriota bacterium]